MTYLWHDIKEDQEINQNQMIGLFSNKRKIGWQFETEQEIYGEYKKII